MNIPHNAYAFLAKPSKKVYRPFYIVWVTFAFFVCSLMICSSAWAKSFEKNKLFQQTSNFSKTVSLNDKQKVSIDNKYGSVVVKTWNNASVKVDVQIKSSAKSTSVAQKAIERVQISETINSEHIAFKTIIKSSGASLFSPQEDERLEIHYTVFIPSKQSLAVKMAYGNVVLPNYQGNIELKVSYGNLTGGDLAGQSDIDAQYSTVRLGKLGKTRLDVKYGKLTLTGAQSMQLNTAYTSPVQLGELQNDISLQLAYCGGVNFELGRNIRNAVVNAQFSHVSAKVDRSTNFEFTATMRYGHHQINGIQMNEVLQTNSNTASSIKGKLGNPKNQQVNFNISYGNLKLNAH
jgi:hypothetical protein